MQKKVSFKQITLITDGQSNMGLSPVLAAKKARDHNIIVNVIGITDEGALGLNGSEEIRGIATAGGGLSQIVSIEHIAKTVQYVTQQSMNKTIQQVINRQLKQILGQGDIYQLPPEERIKVVEVMDHMSEHSHLDILLIVDMSASMRSKLKKIEEALFDFQLSVRSRAGSNQIAIATYPSKENHLEIKIPWTREYFKMDMMISQFIPNGNTPTGPAIEEAIEYFSMINTREKNGILDEYLI